MVKIPLDALSPEVLEALIEEFVSRDGTDLADAGTKIAQVRGQLRSGAIVIVYDEASESANIVPAEKNRTGEPEKRRAGEPEK